MNEIKLCECGCGELAPIAKRTRIKKGWIKGQPMRFVHGHNGRKDGCTVEERFWAKVDKQSQDDCWLWQASIDSKGYGKLGVEGKIVGAHRISYELNCGEIPGNMWVLHTCDNPLCVNPAHLFLGTNQDNIDDRNDKDRQARGVKNGRSKLNPEKVRHIRTLYEIGATQKGIAARFGVDRSAIGQIIRGETWAHVE